MTCPHCGNDKNIEDITTSTDPKQPQKRVYYCNNCSKVFKANV